MKKLSFLLITLLFIASCDNSEEPDKDFSSEDIIAALEDTGESAADDIIDLIESDGAETLMDMLDIMDESSEFGLDFRTDQRRSRILNIAKVFAQSPAARVSTDSPSDYETGVYAWDDMEGDFVFVEEAEDLILKFPVGESETNNGVFTLSSLVINNDDMPEDIEMNITVD